MAWAESRNGPDLNGMINGMNQCCIHTDRPRAPGAVAPRGSSQTVSLANMGGLDALLANLNERAARIVEFSKAKGVAGVNGEDGRAQVAEAHASLNKAAEALAQQTRALHLLIGCAPSDDDLEGCIRDLAKAVELYDSWVGSLLQTALPFVRKAAGAPCALVLQALGAVLQKAAARTLQAADVGRVQEAVEAIKRLETKSVVVARQLLTQSAKLCADALREVHESIAEAKTSGGGAGKLGAADEADEDEDADADAEEEEEAELLGSDAIGGPLESLIGSCAGMVDLACEAGVLQGASDKVLPLLITCAQATSTCIDSAVASAYEEDAAALSSHAQALGKIASRLHDALRDRCGVDAAHEARRAALQAAMDAQLPMLVAACAEEQDVGAVAEGGMGGITVS